LLLFWVMSGPSATGQASVTGGLMFATELALIFVIALLMALAVSFGYRHRRPWSFGTILGVLFLVGLTVAIWARPVGPVVYGFAWLPVFMGSLVVALLMLALGTPRSERTAEVETHARVEGAGAIYIWFLMGSLAVILIASFF
jgi:hypothetical protein